MSDPQTRERFMRAAIAAARHGVGRTYPNPAVGCVIVSGGAIVATGYHEKAGALHAERSALSVLPEHIDPSTCTMYVTLEPCCIHGRTPPCTDAVITSKIPRVVIGSRDPNPRVDGEGVAILRAAGVEVIEGVLDRECDALIRPFAKRILTGLPLVTAKWAMSLDGKIATRQNDSAWITGEAARAHVHRLRDTHDAIMVGKNTLVHDNPRLTCRIDGGRDPWRVVVDARLDAPLSATALDPSTASAPTIVLVGEGANARKREQLLARGVELLTLKSDERGWLDMEQGLRALAARGLTSVLVEGGGGVLGSLLDAQLIDRVEAFIAPKIIGGQRAISPILGRGIASMEDVLSLEEVTIEQLGPDILVRGDIPRRHGATS